MPSYAATPLEFNSGKLKNSASLGFAVPNFNGIMAISPEVLIQSVVPPYYGDKLNLQFWSLLGVPFGTYDVSTSSPLTLTEGYLYVYNHSRGTFTVYDESRQIISTVSDIQSIADMNIDFTIMNSNQFLVTINLSASEYGFIVPVRHLEVCLKGFSEELDSLNHLKTILFDNFYIFDYRIREDFDVYEKLFTLKPNTGKEVPKLIGIDNSDIFDIDNSTWHIPVYMLGIYDYFVYYDIYVEYISKGYDLGILHSLVNRDRINFDSNYPTEYFYKDIHTAFSSFILSEIKWGFSEELEYLLPRLSKDMFPRRQPIVKVDEVNNGRPVYEPWLIYGLEWTLPGITVDIIDEYEVPVFDLSPWWG